MKNFKNMIFNKYEQPQSILLLPEKHSPTKKTVYYYKNKTLQLINDFYANLFSLRNLEKKYWFLIPTFFIFIILSILDFCKKSQEFNNPNFYSIIIYFITMILYFSILKYNEKSIINNHNKKYSCELSSIYEVRNDWMIRNFGKNYATIETLKKFEDWKKYRDTYPAIYKFNWRKFTYQSDAKPRIVGLTIALLTILVTVLIKLSDPVDLESILEQFTSIFNVIVIITPFIVILFYMIIFIFDILRVIINSFFDFIFKNNFSETKYKTFMAFVVNQVEVNDNE